MEREQCHKVSSIKNVRKDGGSWFKCGQLRNGGVNDIADVRNLAFIVSVAYSSMFFEWTSWVMPKHKLLIFQSFCGSG